MEKECSTEAFAVKEKSILATLLVVHRPLAKAMAAAGPKVASAIVGVMKQAFESIGAWFPLPLFKFFVYNIDLYLYYAIIN